MKQYNHRFDSHVRKWHAGPVLTYVEVARDDALLWIRSATRWEAHWIIETFRNSIGHPGATRFSWIFQMANEFAQIDTSKWKFERKRQWLWDHYPGRSASTPELAKEKLRKTGYLP